MPAQDQLRFRAAEPGDAAAIAALHAASWQRHYRGAYSDAFLDGEVTGFLLDTWTTRRPPPTRWPVPSSPSCGGRRR